MTILLLLLAKSYQTAYKRKFAFLETAAWEGESKNIHPVEMIIR